MSYPASRLVDANGITLPWPRKWYTFCRTRTLSSFGLVVVEFVGDFDFDLRGNLGDKAVSVTAEEGRR